MTEPNKRQTFEHILTWRPVWVFLDARVDGVILPNYLRSRPNVQLEYGRMSRAGSSIRTTDEGIVATLAFNGHLFPTVVPWGAIFAICDQDQRGEFWSASMPPDAIPAERRPSPVRHLRLVHSR